MSFYINNKFNFRKRGLLDIIYEDKESVFKSVYTPFIIKKNKEDFLQIKEFGECANNEYFSGEIDDLPEYVFLAIGDFLQKQGENES